MCRVRLGARMARRETARPSAIFFRAEGTETLSGSDQQRRELPADLRAFLYACIDAVEQAEFVVRLKASGEGCTARTLGTELGVPAEFARKHLETLVARGLLQTEVGSDVRYRYAPRSTELRRFAELLVECWAESRTTIVQFIVTQARSPFRTFSDAFDIRKE
jgi:hypothetical protein